jgi:nucleotide-binding universal stress UspA family protein
MYKKILVPLDGSKLAENALEHVIAVAQGLQVDKVILFRVVEPIMVGVKDYIGAESIRAAEKKLEADAKKYLDKIARDLKKDGIPVEAEIVVNGEPAAKILETAKEKNVDLIIMSTHGKSEFLHWVFGSIANKVLAHSSIPLLLVMPKGSQRYKR